MHTECMFPVTAWNPLCLDLEVLGILQHLYTSRFLSL